MGKAAYLVDNTDELKQGWFAGKSQIGVTAGASAPEILIKQVIQRLQVTGLDDLVQRDIRLTVHSWRIDSSGWCRGCACGLVPLSLLPVGRCVGLNLVIEQALLLTT